ncbi:BZ3500_MvSof-1268-A1-R1_Chr6-3g08921 [Microbotryum saponariae]|uniref:BZ3500_MvSof-1268-A1-R1_Chr6-3g08921 protein n=1 Tax=Microbotryum saponariae TaxID=289078 RepID=A0A2X0M641_9BASI|nr:BZ3500_MvSof-1268-A1-R1_Chr6-3g08921 [Microbotryum saponariae]SDA07523.1 BZ3501_MvSof-1269-A2-R1_Chr6-2g08625 [Microbotryum saponariae]
MHFSRLSLPLGIGLITLTNHFVAGEIVATPDLCGGEGWKKDDAITLVCSDASKTCREDQCYGEHNCAMNCKHKWGPVRSWQALDACYKLYMVPKCRKNCYSAAECEAAFGGCKATDGSGCEE